MLCYTWWNAFIFPTLALLSSIADNSGWLPCCLGLSNRFSSLFSRNNRFSKMACRLIHVNTSIHVYAIIWIRITITPPIRVIWCVHISVRVLSVVRSAGESWIRVVQIAFICRFSKGGSRTASDFASDHFIRAIRGQIDRITLICNHIALSIYHRPIFITARVKVIGRKVWDSVLVTIRGLLDWNLLLADLWIICTTPTQRFSVNIQLCGRGHINIFHHCAGHLAWHVSTSLHRTLTSTVALIFSVRGLTNHSFTVQFLCKSLHFSKVCTFELI